MRESYWHYTSMGSSQSSRRVLKPSRPLKPKADNIYIVGLDRYKWYQSRSLTQGAFVPFGPVGCVYQFGPTIPWNTTRTLRLHGGGGVCLSPLTSDGE